MCISKASFCRMNERNLTAEQAKVKHESKHENGVFKKGKLKVGPTW